MKIHQLAVNYLAEQDRILVRLNTTSGEEIRLWLTRRLLLAFWPVLNQEVAEHVARHGSVRATAIAPMAAADEQTRQMLADFNREEMLREADFRTPFDRSPGSFPLGARPLLVTTIGIQPLGTGQLELSFQEKPPAATDKPRGFRTALSDRMMHSFVHLLQRALAKSEWAPERFGGPSATGASAEPGAPDGKPKYLN